MPGTGIMMRLIFLIIVLLLPLHSFGAEAVRLKYALSVYADEKGNGLSQPEGVACRENRLVVADTGNGRILLFSLQGGEPRGGSEIKLSQVRYPVRIKISPKGDILVLDEKQRKIARLTPAGAFKQYVEPSGLPTQSTIVPVGIDIDGNDMIYLLDILAGRVLVLNADGAFLRQVPLPKEYGFITDLTVDSKGTIFIVDSVNAMVYSTAKDTAVFAPITGTMKDDMKFPVNVIMDSSGTLYLSDQNGGGIVMLGQDGSFRGRQLSFGWKEGSIRSPAQVCIDKEGGIIVADRENNRIQVFTPLK